MNPILNFTFEAIRKASQYARQAQSRLDSVRIDIKDKQSFVSEVDVNVQSILLESIQDQLPSCEFVAEESESQFDFSTDYEWAAVIDPIDGTHNYLKQIPYSCISVAFVQKNTRTSRHETKLAMIYDFDRDLLYHAERGKGAFCNNRRIRAGQQKNIDFTHIELSHKMYATHPVLQEALSSHHASTRNYGAYALSLAHVATGKIDALFLGKKAKIWDAAAGSLLVQEAGGMLLPLENDERFDIQSPMLTLAANPTLASKLKQLYQSA